jgi:hypothetical protein
MSLLAPHRRRRRQAVPLAESGDTTHGNPIAASIALAEARTRGRIAESSVEARARALHAENSFASWATLPESDKRLWLHLARVEFLGDLCEAAPPNRPR